MKDCINSGNTDFDEDGGTGDGIEDNVEYYYENVLKMLENIVGDRTRC
jgi:hypothetical protein